MHFDEKLLKNIAETGVISLPQMKLVWEVMQEKMLDQLVNEQESIDLGFAELYPIPYRTNWKNGLFDEFKNLGQELQGKGHDACVEVAKDRGLWAEMSNTRLLAFKNDHIYWGLEVAPKKLWWRNTIKAEKNKRANLSATDYCRHVAKTIYKLKGKLIDV